LNRKRFLFLLLIVLLLIVIVAGWFVTNYFGSKAWQEIISENQASELTLTTYLSSTFNIFESSVKALTGSPLITPALMTKRPQDIESANRTLDRYNSAMHASVTYLMDANGVTVASSNRNDPDSFVGKSYRFRPYFGEAIKGKPFHYFALGVTSNKRGFYASYPVRNKSGKVIGVVTMKKDLDEMAVFFRKYPFCFLINPEGVIFLSSKPGMVLKSLWPLDKTTQEKLIASGQFGGKISEAVTNKEFVDQTIVTLGGKNYFVSRKAIESTGWSVVLMTDTGRVWIYKLTGILTTFFICLLIIFFSGVIYFIDRSRDVIRQSEEKFRMLAESSTFAIMMHRGDRWIYANQAAEEISGYTEAELRGMRFWDIVHPDYRDLVKQSGYDRQQGKKLPRAYEFKIIAKNGAEKWVNLSGNVIQYENKTTALISVMDITEAKRVENILRESEHKYQELSIIDDLTQLYNSRHFYAQLKREIERSNRYKHPLTLMMLDIDNFKMFNDTYGHIEGDYVLSQIGQVVKSCLRGTDSAYRYGGEEFTVILPMTTSEEGMVIAKRMQAKLAKKTFSPLSVQEIYMTISIGIAQYKPKEEMKEFVQRADQFMYEAKKNGKNRICPELKQ